MARMAAIRGLEQSEWFLAAIANGFLRIGVFRPRARGDRLRARARPTRLGLPHLCRRDRRTRAEEPRNNIYVFGIRGEGKSATHRAAALMAQKRFDAKMIHTHTFSLAEVPTAIKYARERIDGAIKVVVKIREN